MVSERKHHHHREHIDDSEVWKRKSLTSAKNREKFARWTNVVLVVMALIVLAACVYAYFIDR